jgi:hypothetical protein
MAVAEPPPAIRAKAKKKRPGKVAPRKKAKAKKPVSRGATARAG